MENSPTFDDQEDTRSCVLQLSDGLALEFTRWRLLVEAGPDAGLEVALGDRPVVLGRSAVADVRLRDSSVSRQHATLQPRGAGWILRDLGSKTGTIVDGVEVGEVVLTPAHRARIGETEFVLRRDRSTLRSSENKEENFEGLVSGAPSMARLFGMVEKVARVELPVLFLGESGTGKEGLARAVHRRGERSEGPYEVVDCTLLGSEHMRSELFGHVKGAFTGADQDRDGAFVRADGGTLFLDEVGEIPAELQPLLLRVLEEGEVRPLGGGSVRKVSVRVVAATNRDLAAMVEAGSFRRDLFHRLAVLELEVPPLRERPGDSALLAAHFLPDGFELTEPALRALVSYPWPGNVRELRNKLERAAALADGKRLGPQDLGLPDARGAGGDGSGGAPVSLDDYEAIAIKEALERCGGNKKEAALQLGISRTTLYRRLKELGLE